MSEKQYWDSAVETQSREQLEAYQLQQLRKHLEWAYTQSPYYKASFDKAGVKPEDLHTLDDLRRFPFV
ncbi:TPA: CoF synthetase, partial [Candidatus Sumerlaeota bacterium]|nr:CoF synthetase [Candidatus Sumerlaeota bacterium]